MATSHGACALVRAPKFCARRAARGSRHATRHAAGKKKSGENVSGTTGADWRAFSMIPPRLSLVLMSRCLDLAFSLRWLVGLVSGVHALETRSPPLSPPEAGALSASTGWRRACLAWDRRPPVLGTRLQRCTAANLSTRSRCRGTLCAIRSGRWWKTVQVLYPGYCFSDGICTFLRSRHKIG